MDAPRERQMKIGTIRQVSELEDLCGNLIEKPAIAGVFELDDRGPIAPAFLSR
jgi:hypothetical protein